MPTKTTKSAKSPLTKGRPAHADAQLKCLMEKASAGETKEVMEMLSNPECYDPDVPSLAFTLSARAGHSDLARRLLAAFPDIQADPETRLLLAAIDGNPAHIDYALTGCGPGSLPSAILPSAIHVAIVNNNPQAAIQMIARMPAPSSARCYSDALLRTAIESGHMDVAVALFDHGITKVAAAEILTTLIHGDPNTDLLTRALDVAKTGDKNLFTSKSSAALSAAAEKGRLEHMKVLMPFVDPKIYDSQALLRAATHGQLDAVRLLLPASEPKTLFSAALRAATKAGHLEVVRLLAPVSDVTAKGEESLRHAVRSNRTGILKLLLSEIKKAEAEGRLLNYVADARPLHTAARRGRLKHIDLLLPGREKHVRDAANYALENNQTSAVARLLPHMPSPKDVVDLVMRATALGNTTALTTILDTDFKGLSPALRERLADPKSRIWSNPDALAIVQAHLDAQDLRGSHMAMASKTKGPAL